MPLSNPAVLERVLDLRGGVVRRNAREIVAAKIASLIATGILQVGDVLPSERDLAAAFRLSRETVRGSMQILAARGIIEVSHGARTRVVSADVGPLDADPRGPKLINNYDIEEVHAARRLVELPVVVAAAERIDAETLALLEDSLAAQHAAIDDPVRFLICDREFHLAIYRACGNPVLADFVSDLYTYMLDHRREAMARPGAIANSYEDHAAILAALRAHDAEAVLAAFDVHLNRIYTTTRSILADGPGSGGAKRSKSGAPSEAPPGAPGGEKRFERDRLQ